MVYNTVVVEIREFVDEYEVSPFDEWLTSQDVKVRARVQSRLTRLQAGNFGDHKSLGAGVHELRIDFGPGYRVYYGKDGNTLVILLGGGTKKRQAKDINNAKLLWTRHKRNK